MTICDKGGDAWSLDWSDFLKIGVREGSSRMAVYADASKETKLGSLGSRTFRPDVADQEADNIVGFTDGIVLLSDACAIIGWNDRVVKALAARKASANNRRLSFWEQE